MPGAVTHLVEDPQYKTHMDVYTIENKKFYYNKKQSRPGSNNGRAKMDEDEIYNIRLKKKNGENIKMVYEDYTQ